MTKKVLTVAASFVLLALCAVTYSYLTKRIRQHRTDNSPTPISDVRGAGISSTPTNIQMRFEAVIVNRPKDRCIDVFIPDEFEKYNGDVKWAISSDLGFDPGLFDRVRDSGRGIVSGKYVFVKDAHDGPCGVVTGKLFEIDEIDYF